MEGRGVGEVLLRERSGDCVYIFGRGGTLLLDLCAHGYRRQGPYLVSSNVYTSSIHHYIASGACKASLAREGMYEHK